MYQVNKLNKIILDSLPHWAMLIDVKTRTILAANKMAIESGATIACQCWDDFAHRQFLSDEHKEMINKDPDLERDNQIKCDFCLADEAMELFAPQNKEVEIDGTFWDTWWVPVKQNIYLHYAINITETRKTQSKLEKALEEIKTLRGILPICASCKKIRDDQGYWNQIEEYIGEHSGVEFTHSICPECVETLYPDIDLTSR
jgi:hypothetical protein